MTDETRNQESGFAVLMVLVLMIPLVLTAAAFATVMVDRNGALNADHDEELAMLTAETGVDYALWRARTGALISGTPQTFTYGTSRWFVIDPTHLLTDTVDNDNDGLTDEPDEDVFQVVITAHFRKAKRRIVAYLGPKPLLPVATAALTTMDPNVVIELTGTPAISGNDMMIGGSAGSQPPLPGLATTSPGTTTHLLSELSPAEQAGITGSTAAPSLAVTTAWDLPTVVNQAKNFANRVLKTNSYADYDFGNGPAGTTTVTYRNGNVKFSGNSRGAGVLVVTGDLDVTGNFRFDGVVIVLGKLLNSTGTATILGTVVQGEAGAKIDAKGAFSVHYSSEALALADGASGRYVLFNGWQEITEK